MKQDSSVQTLSSIPELDSEAGLRAVRGNQTLYLKLLHRFAEQLQQFVSEFEQARQQSDGSERLLAHTLKGTAGNLGAFELQRLAAELERACRDQQPSDMQLAALSSHAESLLTALKQLDTPS